MPAVSEDELFTLVFLLSALLVGSVLVGYPVDWSAVFPEGDAGGSAVRLAGVLVVAGGLAAGGRLDGGVVGLLGATTAVGLMTDRARAAILGQRIRGGDELDGRSTTGGLVKLALRLALVGLATSRTDAGWALLVRLADGSSPTGGGALLVLVGTWAVSDREVRRLLGGLVQGAEEAEEEAPPESKVAALEAAQAGRWGDWSFTVRSSPLATSRECVWETKLTCSHEGAGRTGLLRARRRAGRSLARCCRLFPPSLSLPLSHTTVD